jgi:hypothetical protein
MRFVGAGALQSAPLAAVFSMNRNQLANANYELGRKLRRPAG